MKYYIEGTCWSQNKANESHLEENCVDMTYAIFDADTKKAVSTMYATKQEAKSALKSLLETL